MVEALQTADIGIGLMGLGFGMIIATLVAVVVIKLNP